MLCPLLFDGADRNLRGDFFYLAAFEQAVFDVCILALALCGKTFSACKLLGQSLEKCKLARPLQALN